MAENAFSEWFQKKGSEWLKKASDVFKDDDDAEEEKKKKYIEFSEKKKNRGRIRYRDR